MKASEFIAKFAAELEGGLQGKAVESSGESRVLVHIGADGQLCAPDSDKSVGYIDFRLYYEGDSPFDDEDEDD